MRVAIIQPSFFPWRGYFDIIASADLFIFYDDLQYTKQNWRNRNIIKTQSGPKWLTVPVKTSSLLTPICETLVDYSSTFMDHHLRQVREAYRSAPYVDSALNLVRSTYRVCYPSISELAIASVSNTCSLLGITTPLVKSSDMGVVGAKTDRLIAILTRVGATTYLSGPSADAYLDKGLFAAHSIRLEYKNYDYRTYPQLWGEFTGQVSILDLVANVGARCRDFLVSGPDTVVVDTARLSSPDGT